MSDDLSPRRARTRAGVLDAALQEFIARGYGGATLAGVADRAGVSTATLHAHFATKRALFGGVMARFWETGDDAPQLSPAGADPRANLIAIGRAYADLLSRPETAPLFRVIIAESITHPELGEELYLKGKKPYLDGLEAYVAAQIAAGRLCADEPALAVRQFLGMINDVLFWPRMIRGADADPAGFIDRVVAEAADTFLARYRNA